MSKFNYRNVVYSSFQKGCEAAGVSRAIAYKIMRVHGCSKQEALDIGRASATMKRGEFEYNGVSYKTLNSYCTQHGVSVGTVYKIMSTHKCSASEALDIWYETIAPKKLLSPTTGQFISKIGFAALYGVSYDSVRRKTEGELEEYIALRIEQGLTLSSRFNWIAPEWRESEQPIYSLDIFCPREELHFVDDSGNMMFQFRDINGTYFEVQYQTFGLWLFRAYPELTCEESEMTMLNSASAYGVWSIDALKRVRLQYIHLGEKDDFKAVLRVLSVISRSCVEAIQSVLGGDSKSDQKVQP